jgi:hypothetical protein
MEYCPVQYLQQNRKEEKRLHHRDDATPTNPSPRTARDVLRYAEERQKGQGKKVICHIHREIWDKDRETGMKI